MFGSTEFLGLLSFPHPVDLIAMKSSLFCWLFGLLIGWNLLLVMALGIVVPPVRLGEAKAFSSSDNLNRCIAYHASPQEFVTVSVKVGQRLPSQSLNLLVLDENNNILRSQPDLSDQISFMFTNLAPVDLPGSSDSSLRRVAERIGLVRRNMDSHHHQTRPKNRVILPEEHFADAARIYICFDNIYNDKSWSFLPRDWDVDLKVSFKYSDQLNVPDYNAYAQRFEASKAARRFSKTDFDQSMDLLGNDLDSIAGLLDISAGILEKLMTQEYGLRDANEQIFHEFTLYTIIVMVAVAAFSFIKLIYVCMTLKKRLHR